MRKLIRSFERSGLEYLIISGQASILYGAASFSEDLDIWIRPTRPNARRLLEALARCGARVHKLTPPLTEENMRAGHGFHFVIPARPVPVYLDAMGKPPRVGTFLQARRRSRVMATRWGNVPVVSIQDLVALKQTRRLSDYEVISNLVSIIVAESGKPSRPLLRWAARRAYRAEDRAACLRRLGGRATLGGCRREILKEVARLQARDTSYWKKIIARLRRLRQAGRLWPEGAPVTSLPRFPLRREK